MRCEQAGEMMSARMDGRLDSTKAAHLERHAAACNECQAEWHKLESLDRLLASAPMAPAPARLRVQVMARLSRREQARRAIVGGTTLALGTLALTLLLLAPVIPGLLGAGGMLPVLARVGPETITQVLALLGTTGRTMLVLVESLAVPVAVVGLCGLATALMLNALCIQAVRRLRAR